MHFIKVIVAKRYDEVQFSKRRNNEMEDLANMNLFGEIL